jgi:hypothetical protein
MKTTLNKIRKYSPCEEGWTKLLSNLGKTKADNSPLSIITILQSNGLDDALWCLRAVEGHDREIRLFAVWCARQVQHLMTDPRSIKALDIAEAYANGTATKLELEKAREAARAVWEEGEAAGAAWEEGEAALAAAWVAGETAGALAGVAARVAVRASAWASAREAQSKELTRVYNAIDSGIDPYPVI